MRSPVAAPAAPQPNTTRAATQKLLDQMELMPSHPTVALRVLWLADDPTSTLASLANTVELDPIISGRLMRIANSAYYSLRTPVTNVPRAITVLGFTTVRALAAAAASGVSGSKHPIPAEFWEHAAACANAAQLVAAHYDVPAPDAFALGLLHDLGSGLLYLADREAWAHVEAYGPGSGTAEEELFGITHQALGARILESWRFPREFCEAVARHHHRLDQRESPLTRCLIAAELLAEVALNQMSVSKAASVKATLQADGFDADHLERMIERVRAESAALAQVLASDEGET